jgi:hypothetical protein
MVKFADFFSSAQAQSRKQHVKNTCASGFKDAGIGSDKLLHENAKLPRNDLQACAEATRTLVWFGRFFLILSAVSLISMPLTQHLWTWDHFLHGGQDFELAALMVLTVVCLVLVNSQQCKGCVASMLARWYRVACKSRKRESAEIQLQRAASILRDGSEAGPASGFYNIPLQI